VEKRINKADYMKTKKKFIELCKEKAKTEKEIEKTRNAKTEREIWGYINEGRKKTQRKNKKFKRGRYGVMQTKAEKRKQTGESIKGEEWREHFRNTLKGKEEKTIGEKRIIVMPQDDIEELEDIETEEQIDKQKTQKASGEDKIPSEAWKFCGESVKRRLIETIKGVWRGEGFPSN